MSFENDEFNQLPCSTDLVVEPPGFEHLLVGDAPPLQDSTGGNRRIFSFGLLSSCAIHALLLLLLHWLVQWEREVPDVSHQPSFDIALSGFAPTLAEQTHSNENTDVVADNAAEIPNREEISQPAHSDSTLSSEEFSDTEVVAENAQPPVESENNALQESFVREHIQNLADDDAESPPVVTTEARSPIVAPQNQNNLTSEDAAQQVRMAILPSQALNATQLNTLEARIQRWQEDIFEQLQQSDELSWQHQEHTYTAQIRQLPAQTATDLDRVEITVSTLVDGRQMQTTMTMKRLAFSNYGQFVNHWGRDMYLHQDEIEGRFHSNSTIQIENSRKAGPVFHGPVTTSYDIDILGWGRKSDLFLHGLETRVKRIPFPSDIAPNSAPREDTGADIKGEVQQNIQTEPQVLTLTDDATVVFYRDGSFSWQYKKEKVINRTVIGAQTYYIVGAPDCIISVKGIVNGRVTVYSPEEISIIGDIRYHTDPESVPESSDFLALVSEKYVEIASPSLTGPGDLTVYAAIYAKRRFSVRLFSDRNNGLLTIYGSLSAGSLSATEPRYATLVRYDQRFEQQRPPDYPMTERYELETWDQQWRVVN